MSKQVVDPRHSGAGRGEIRTGLLVAAAAGRQRDARLVSAELARQGCRADAEHGRGAVVRPHRRSGLMFSSLNRPHIARREPARLVVLGDCAVAVLSSR
jgi:hypothetical protein